MVNIPICGAVLDWFFHHDNVPAHTAIPMREFLAKNSITPPPHSPTHQICHPVTYFCFSG